MASKPNIKQFCQGTKSVETEPIVDSARKSSNETSKNDLQLALPYDVLLIIFADLLARDLSNAARVCRLWREVASKQLKRRQIIATMSSYQEAFHGCDTKSHFHNLLTNKPMLGFFLCNSSECPLPTCITGHLPRQCISVGLFNPGIISGCTELDETSEKVVYALLPEDKNVHIECVIAMNSGIISLNKKKQYESQGRCNAGVAISAAIKRLKDVKCLILFTSDALHRPANIVEKSIFKDSIKVIWGGAAEQIFLGHNGHKIDDIDWLALMIAGPRVHSWSTVVETGNDEKCIAEKLLQLKEKIRLQTHTLGFMFSCVAKGSQWYNGRKNVESTIFTNTFPEIPLIGSFGNGEHGSNSDRPLTSRDRIYHQYSTVFMILTYG